jgi:hypothetical protein
MGEPVKIRYMAEQMIRLAGREPVADIEIRYIGLRPGEKRFEELFYDAEDLIATSHPKIRTAASSPRVPARARQARLRPATWRAPASSPRTAAIRCASCWCASVWCPIATWPPPWRGARSGLGSGPTTIPMNPSAGADQLSLRFLKDAHIVPLRDDDDGSNSPSPTRSTASRCRRSRWPPAGRCGCASACPRDRRGAGAALRAAQGADAADTDLEADLGNFSEEDIEHLRDLASEAPVIRLVNQIMQRAVESRASDIHIEPFADELKVRYRIDGILKEANRRRCAPPPR